MRKIFFLLMVAVMAARFCGGDELQEKKDKLSLIKEQLKVEKEKEQKLQLKEKNEKKALEETKKNLVEVLKEVDRYKGQVRDKKGKLVTTKDTLQKKSRELTDYQALVSARMDTFYRKSLLLSVSEGLDGLFQLRNFSFIFNAFRTILEQDAAGVFRIENEKKKVEVKKSSLEKEVKVLSSSLSVKNKEKSHVETAKKEKEKTVNSVRNELSRSIEKQRQLSKEAASLQKMIETLLVDSGVPKKTLDREAVLFEREKDKLPWPVAKGKITGPFGWNSSEKYPTPIFNSGIDIEVEGTQNVMAVSKGKIMFSGVFRSYGNMVIIDHGGGYSSVYSGLKEVYAKTDKTTEKESIIGTVSSSFHFEMRKDAKPIDPLDWLKNK